MTGTVSDPWQDDQVNYDELGARVRADQETLAAAAEEAEGLRADIAWYDALDPAAALSTATAHAEMVAAERAEVAESLRSVGTRVRRLRAMSLVAYHPLVIGSERVRTSPRRLRDAKAERAELTSRHAQLEAEDELARTAVIERRDEAARHAAFDRAAAGDRLAELDTLTTDLTPGHEERAARLAAVDEQLEPLLRDLSQASADRRRAATGSGRASKLDSQVERLVKQIRRVKRKGTLDARRVIIDGSNLTFDDTNQPVGLAAVHALATHLQQTREVLVVFDASILRQLKLPDAAAVKSAMAGVDVHVVASKTVADELILQLADEETTYVLSNDTYPEYRGTPAMRDHRVLDVNIIDSLSLVVVQMLDVKVNYTRSR